MKRHKYRFKDRMTAETAVSRAETDLIYHRIALQRILTGEVDWLPIRSGAGFRYELGIVGLRGGTCLLVFKCTYPTNTNTDVCDAENWANAYVNYETYNDEDRVVRELAHEVRRKCNEWLESECSAIRKVTGQLAAAGAA